MKILKCKGFWDKDKGILLKNKIVKFYKNGKIEFLTSTKENYVETGYLIPPFFDAHSHLFLSGSSNLLTREQELNFSIEKSFQIIEKNIKANLNLGIYGVRDAGDNKWAALQYRNKVNNFIISSSGKALFKQGRYGNFIGLPITNKKSLKEAFKILEQKNVNVVKILNSGINSVKIFAKETAPQFSKRELDEIVTFAKLNNLKTMVHVNGKRAIKETLKSNIDSIEHCFFIGDENRKQIVDKGLKIVPTFSAMYNLVYNNSFSNNEKKIIIKTVEFHIEEIKKFLKLNGEICLGTDAGSFNVAHSEAFYQEIKFFIEKLNLTFEQLLKIITKKNFDISNIKNQKNYPFLINLEEFDYHSLINKKFKIIFPDN